MELTIEQTLQQGVAAHKEGKLEEAERLYRAILQFQPTHPDANHNLALIAVSVNKTEAALPLFKTALEANPKIEHFWLSYINALLKQKKVEAANTVILEARRQGFDGEKINTLENQLNQLRISSKIFDKNKNFIQKEKRQKLFESKQKNAQNKNTNRLGPPQSQVKNLVEQYQKKQYEVAEKLARSTTTNFPEYQLGWKILGAVLRTKGKMSESLYAKHRAVELDPQDADAHSNMGLALQDLHRYEEAIASYEEVIKIRPDCLQTKHILAFLTGQTTSSAPRAYVETLFDGYASIFDLSLVDMLEYKIPKIIYEVMNRDNAGNSFGAVLDLGCGTGLTGVELKSNSTYLEGIDLSNEMLGKAREKNVYDKLSHRDISDYLSTEDLNFDYFISTDVFIYVGELSDIFKLIKSRNRTGGKLVFSTENTDKDGFFLEKTGRYTHSKKYIESLCDKFNYTLSHFETVNLRKDQERYITGDLYLLDF